MYIQKHYIVILLQWQWGTGLGLAIVQCLISHARGGLHVHSSCGQGTAFTLYLAARLSDGGTSLQR